MYLTHITNAFYHREKRKQSFFHIVPARSTTCRILYAPPLTHSPHHSTLHHHQHKYYRIYKKSSFSSAVITKTFFFIS